jgi:hypothetical protein
VSVGSAPATVSLRGDWFSRIIPHPTPRVQWLLGDDTDGLIAKGSRVVLYGEFGSWKSWLALDLAMALATGQPWLGHFKTHQPRSVLYVDEEMAFRTLARRIKRLAMGYGLNGPAAETLPALALTHVGLRLDTPESAAQFLDDVQQQWDFDPDVIVVETIRRVLVGSEVDAKDVANLWRAVEPWRDEQGKRRTILLVHHMRKRSFQGPNTARERASGSTDLLAGADVGLAIERDYRSRDVLTVECVKSRDSGEPRFSVSAHLTDPDGPVVFRFQGHADKAGTASRSPQLDLAKTRILEYVTERPGMTWPAIEASVTAAPDSEGRRVSKSTAQRARRDLASLGQIEAVSGGLFLAEPDTTAVA